MKGLVNGLAVLYVVLLPFGRSGLPLNAQWGDLVFPLLVVAAVRSAGGGPWWGREDWPLALYLAVTLLTAVASPEPATGLQQIAKQVYVASIFLTFRRLTHAFTLSARLQASFVLAVAALTAVSIPIVFLRIPAAIPPSVFGAIDTLPFFGQVHRLRAAFLTPEMLGNIVLVAFALSLGLWIARGRDRGGGWLAAAGLLAAGAVLTISHSIAGFSVAFAAFIGTTASPLRFRRLAWIGAVTVVTVVTVVNVASLVDFGAPRNDYGVAPVSIELMGARIDGSLIHYAALKQVAWRAFVENPIIGVGPGRFNQATERAFADGRLTRRYRDKPPHCDLMGRLAETGIGGGVSLVLLWISWFRGWRRQEASPTRLAARAAVLGLLVNSLNADVMNFRFLWLALAWASPSSPPHGSELRSETSPAEGGAV